MNTDRLNAQLRANLDQVRARMAEACRRVGRDPGEVRLVAVTKYADEHTARALRDAGVADLGENRVQQLATRAAALGAAPAGLFDPLPADAAPRWHMVGHLQRNKVRAWLSHSRILHALDSERLAQEIEKQAAGRDLVVDAFLELNLAGEDSKTGAPIDQAAPLAEAVGRCGHIRLHGLMGMPPYSPDPEAARPYFARLRELLEQLRRSGAVGPQCRHLSMGMSGDYPVAIEEGATFVRVGAALFAGIDLRRAASE